MKYAILLVNNTLVNMKTIERAVMSPPSLKHSFFSGIVPILTHAAPFAGTQPPGVFLGPPVSVPLLRTVSFLFPF